MESNRCYKQCDECCNCPDKPRCNYDRELKCGIVAAKPSDCKMTMKMRDTTQTLN